MITALTEVASPHWHGGGWSPFPGLLFGLLFLALLATVAFWFGRRLAGGPGANRSGSAEDTLAERYAKGEMSDDEYLQRQSVLRGHHGRKNK